MRLRLRRRSRRPQQPGGLRITSMMDILTVLLLFLLKSFVAEGEVVTPAPGVTLPESSSQDTPRASLVIAIAADHIRLGDEVITRLDGSVDGGLGSDLYIDRLGAELQRVRQQQQALAARRGREEDFVGKVTIQGDRDLSFAVLQRVMYTCNESGYPDVALAVIRG
jgi:biopolymer transport protein ExbD